MRARVMTRGWTVALAVAALAGCSDPAAVADGGVDGGVDAALHDAVAEGPSACTPAFGHSYIFSHIELPPADAGHALGVMAVALNAGFEESITSGDTLYMWDLARWEPQVADDADVGIYFYQGFDADDDPGNNLGGAGTFLVPAQQFDLDCQPTNPWDEARIEGGRIHASTHAWSWVRPGTGTITILNAVVEGPFDADFDTLQVEVRGSWSICGMSHALVPGSVEGTFLDLIVAGYQTDPDVDLDGNGLERLVDDGTKVVECIDEDGTVIPGRDCPCDPRMGDAYSVIMQAHGVRATIVGVRDGS
jgi:hypothetical protein